MLITCETGITGLTPGYTILNADKTEYAARTTTGITDLGGGTYAATVADSTLAGRTVLWDTGEVTPRYATETFPGYLAVLGAASVTVSSPVAASGAVTIERGDDYKVAHGRAVSFSVADSGHALELDNVAAVLRLKCAQATWTASTVTSTAAGYTVIFEPTAAQTAALTVERQTYEVEATLADTSVVTLARGTLVTNANIAAIA